MRDLRVFGFQVFSLGCLAAAAGQTASTANLPYFGRASVKITTATGRVVYIDPYAPGDYS